MKPGFEPTSKDHDSDCESLTFITRPESFALKKITWQPVYDPTVFHRLGQAKFADGGSILGSNQLSLLSKLPLKNDIRFKSG